MYSPSEIGANSCQNPIRVLLIEDHVPLAEGTAEFLRSRGMDVEIARSGEAGLVLAAAFKPEIILCDLRLPDMPGLEVVRHLRAGPNTKDALIAVHTAMDEMDIRSLRRLVDANEVNLFVSKPMTEEKVEKLLDSLACYRPCAKRRIPPK
jgi:CheY-like chemotaxis protein